MYEATLSIDLGASYTKLAYRPACPPEPNGERRQDAMVLVFDDSPLIPSLAIRTRNRNHPWMFGRQAAQMNPDKEMQVFQNWKAGLFRPSNDKDSATAAIIAHRFFDWLRSKVEATGIDVRECQTRVAMPAFDTFDENAVLLARCMDLSGWDKPTLILKVREPHANTLGLFAGGRNVIGRTGPLYGPMFGEYSIYVRAARGHLFGTQGNLLIVMVVDIGAFTMDLAMLTFDVTAPADGLRAIRQESHALGVINDLDKPLFATLAERHGFSWAALSFDESELCKNRLYQRQPHTLLTRVNGNAVQIELGGPADTTSVEDAATRFAAAAAEKIAAFTLPETPSNVFLTGGGSQIRPLADALKAFLEVRQIRTGCINPTSEAIGTGDRRSWDQSGEGLQRLATAVGGASVVLQEAAIQPIEEGHPTFRAPVQAASIDGCAACRCQGGNKDCCFCGGCGFVRL